MAFPALSDGAISDSSDGDRRFARRLDWEKKAEGSGKASLEVSRSGFEFDLGRIGVLFSSIRRGSAS